MIKESKEYFKNEFMTSIVSLSFSCIYVTLLDVEIVLVLHTSLMVSYSLFHYKRGCWWNPKDPEGSINGLWNSQAPSK